MLLHSLGFVVQVRLSFQEKSAAKGSATLPAWKDEFLGENPAEEDGFVDF